MLYRIIKVLNEAVAWVARQGQWGPPPHRRSNKASQHYQLPPVPAAMSSVRLARLRCFCGWMARRVLRQQQGVVMPTFCAAPPRGPWECPLLGGWPPSPLLPSPTPRSLGFRYLQGVQPPNCVSIVCQEAVPRCEVPSYFMEQPAWRLRTRRECRWQQQQPGDARFMTPYRHPSLDLLPASVRLCRLGLRHEAWR